jgi:hypothetical protein
LKANPQNEGKEFLLEFTVEPSIKGGLQMYTETEFMDMSLSSRLDKLKSEVSKLVEWQSMLFSQNLFKFQLNIK